MYFELVERLAPREDQRDRQSNTFVDYLANYETPSRAQNGSLSHWNQLSELAAVSKSSGNCCKMTTGA